jgi:hypothetical protein
VLLPAVTAAIGIAGGVVLGRRSRPAQPTVMGRRLPRPSIDFGDVGRQIASAGQQLGRLAGEVEAVRDTAQKIARAIG